MQTIGERLEDARKQKGISIREAAEATKIRGEYLQKFESNHFDLGLSKIYVRGFLRTYANFLKLPAERLLNDHAALGNDEPRPRQPSREIYGRMDVSVASVADRGDRVERHAPTAEDAAAEAQRAQAKYSRGRPNLPPAPMFDPALVLKFGKIAGVALVALLIVWGAYALLGGGKSSIRTLTPAPIGPTVTLIALDALSVQVVSAADGKMLLPNTPLVRGQTQIVPWPGELLITATVGENLQIEAEGKRFGVGFKGFNRGRLPAPGKL